MEIAKHQELNDPESAREMAEPIPSRSSFQSNSNAYPNAEPMMGFLYFFLQFVNLFALSFSNSHIFDLTRIANLLFW